MFGVKGRALGVVGIVFRFDGLDRFLEKLVKLLLVIALRRKFYEALTESRLAQVFSEVNEVSSVLFKLARHGGEKRILLLDSMD